MSDELLSDWGWTCILQARDADWAACEATSFTVQGVDIEIRRGGAWGCARDLDRPTRDLLDLFLPWVATAAPVVIAQIGQSLDGRIATASGASHYINGEAARAHLHRLRALVDAVVVGVGTVNADDPQLTVRHVAGRNPVRVVLDPRGRAKPSARLFGDGLAPTLHLVAAGLPAAEAAPAAQPCGAGGAVLRIELASGEAGFEPAEVLARLARRGWRRVLVEGGGVTVSRFLQAGVLDRLHVMVAPMLIGAGPAGLVLPPIDRLDEAIRPPCRHFACGEDVVFDLALRPLRDPP